MLSTDRVIKTRDGSHTLWSQCYRQSFGSVRGALTESRTVYLAPSGVKQRFRDQLPTRVLEVGFGTGLNFLITADEAWRYRANLDYVALEVSPLSPTDINRLQLQRHVRFRPLYAAWYSAYSKSFAFPIKRDWEFQLPPFVHSQLLVGDATQKRLPSGPFDAIYLDAFSPAMNSKLWTEAFLTQLAERLNPEGCLVSYCVRGAVRRQLANAGLTVTRIPGPPGGKRESLLAKAKPRP